jgi:hypothetical protein
MIKPEKSSTSRLNLAFCAMPLKQGLFNARFVRGVTSAKSSKIWIKMGVIEESQTLRPLPQVREKSPQISRDKLLSKIIPTLVGSPLR